MFLAIVSLSSLGIFPIFLHPYWQIFVKKIVEKSLTEASMSFKLNVPAKNVCILCGKLLFYILYIGNSTPGAVDNMYLLNFAIAQCFRNEREHYLTPAGAALIAMTLRLVKMC